MKSAFSEAVCSSDGYVFTEQEACYPVIAVVSGVAYRAALAFGIGDGFLTFGQSGVEADFLDRENAAFRESRAN